MRGRPKGRPLPCWWVYHGMMETGETQTHECDAYGHCMHSLTPENEVMRKITGWPKEFYEPVPGCPMCEAGHVELTTEGSQTFAGAVVDPKPPADALVRAARRHKNP